jgi:hypothetical protein
MSDESADIGGMSGPTDYSWIGDIVEQAIMSQHEAAVIRNEVQHNPCGLAAYLRELLGTTQQHRISEKWAAVREKADFLPIAVADSLLNLGNAAPGYDIANSKRLAEYMIDALGVERLIPVGDLIGIGFLAGPFGPHAIAAGQLQWIEDHLPSGSSIASGEYLEAPSQGGTVVSPGIKIKNGRYRGVGIKGVIFDWTKYQAENVSTGFLGNAREDLIRMVGSWTGSGRYGIWQEGDAILEGSELSNLLYMFEDMRAMEKEAQDLCDTFNIGVQKRADRALAGQLDLYGADLENQRLEIERKQRRDQMAVVGAVVLGAAILVKKK